MSDRQRHMNTQQAMYYNYYGSVNVVRYAHETEWESVLVVKNIRATSGGEEEKKKEENKTHRQ